jgi:hypothetical protein
MYIVCIHIKRESTMYEAYIICRHVMHKQLNDYINLLIYVKETGLIKAGLT